MKKHIWVLLREFAISAMNTALIVSHCKNAFDSGMNGKGKQDFLCLCDAPTLKMDFSPQGVWFFTASVQKKRKLNPTC